MTPIDHEAVQAHRERVERLCRDLVDAMGDAVDLLGTMSRDITALDPEGQPRGRYRITIERV